MKAYEINEENYCFMLCIMFAFGLFITKIALNLYDKHNKSSSLSPNITNSQSYQEINEEAEQIREERRSECIDYFERHRAENESFFL